MSKANTFKSIINADTIIMVELAGKWFIKKFEAVFNSHMSYLQGECDNSSGY